MIVIRLLLTAAMVVLSVFAIHYVWTTYFEAPWTRDAYVRADIVEMASQVSGTVVELGVKNNDVVRKGQLIMRIDPSDYELAVAQAEAQVAQAEASANLEAQQAARYNALNQRDSAAVAGVEVANARLQAQSAQAALQAARVELKNAKVDLQRTTVVAPVDGYVTNLLVDRGDYATAGTAVLALVDRNSYRVDAFFMETKLPEIPVGAPARIELMAGGEILTGHVQGIARAIYDAQATSEALLQNPTPSFQWIRLAQRIPVTISLDTAPDRFPLVSGQTATVILEAADGTNASWSRRIETFFKRLFGSDETADAGSTATRPQQPPDATSAVAGGS